MVERQICDNTFSGNWLSKLNGHPYWIYDMMCVFCVFRRSRWQKAVKFLPHGRIRHLQSSCSSSSSMSPTLTPSWKDKPNLTLLRWGRTHTGTSHTPQVFILTSLHKWQGKFVGHIVGCFCCIALGHTVKPHWSKIPLYTTA